MSSLTSTGDFPTLLTTTANSNVYQMGGVVPSHIAVSASAGSGDNALDELKVKGLDAFITSQEKEMPKATGRRIIQIFIVDTDTRVPLEKCLLYKGEQKLTDSTDEELFYEIEVKSLLDEHNLYRQGVIDKKATERLGRDVYLEDIKIRNLTMTVVETASF